MLLISPVLWVRGVLVVVLVAFWMTALPLTSVFSVAFLPAVVAPVLLLLLLMMLLALLGLLAGAVDLCWVTQRVCLSCWTSHLDFYYAFLLRTLEVLEAVVVVDYFRCCCLVPLLALLVVVAAKLPVRQKLQERLDRLDPDPHYCCLPAPFWPSTLTLPSLAGA